MFLKRTWRLQRTRKKSTSLSHSRSRQVLSDDDTSSSDSNDEEYAMTVRDFKKFFRRRGKFVRQPYDEKKNFQKIKEDKKAERRCFKCGDPNHFISDCPKNFLLVIKRHIVVKVVAIVEMWIKDKKIFVSCSLKRGDQLKKLFVKLACRFHSSTSLASSNEQHRLFDDSAEKGKELETNVRQKVKLDPDEWIQDSGCTRHMTGNKDLFSSYKPFDGGNVLFGSNTKSKIIGKGQICDKKCNVLSSETGSKIIRKGITLGKGIRKNGLYNYEKVELTKRRPV
ncbi:zf-CCHC domain-containing protein [Tanacetum coccineum]